MSLVNSYATLQNFLDFRATTDTDAVDDGVIETLLKSTSQYIDSYCSRTFYPRIETRVYDLPEDEQLNLDDDLLAVISLKHGDSDTIASSDYILLSANFSPKWALSLRDISSISWSSDATSSVQQVISLNGWWGYHDKYSQRAWSSGGLLDAALTANATTFTMQNGHTVLAGNIVKIDTEVMNIASVSSSDTVTPVARGDNGSTAASHTSDSVVYVWNPMYDIQQACLEITASAYRRRKGQNMSGAAQVTGAGVVITPQDVPGQAREILNKYVRVA